MITPQDIKLAKRLAVLIVKAGESGIAELKPALEKILAGRSGSDRKQFLKAFQKAASREIAKDTLTIESAQPLEVAVVDQIVQHFSQNREQPLHVQQAIVPDLISGVRVRLGDTVYDASLAHSLQSLAARIH